MAGVKQFSLTGAKEWWDHLRPFGKREFWKQERQAHNREIAAEKADLQNKLDMNRGCFLDEFGNTCWPDSTQ